LTTFTLERQLEVWMGETAGELNEEERRALEGRELWDALAVRHRTRLMGWDSGAGGAGVGTAESMGAFSFLLFPCLSSPRRSSLPSLPPAH
jgi:hypothetical protein